MIDFNFIEFKFVLDVNGDVLGVEECIIDEVEVLIEFFMIFVNEIVLRYFFFNDLLGIYWIYEKFILEKLDIVFEFSVKFGFRVD